MGRILKKYGFIPFSEPLIGKEEREAVLRVLKREWLTTGPETKSFEEEFKEYIGASTAVALNSATAGLHISLIAEGVEKGDDVMLPSFTFVSTANVVLKVSANPVFIDINSSDFTISYEKIKEKIEKEYEFDGKKLLSKKSGNRLSAIMVVHYGGVPAELSKIESLAKKFNLKVIEDSAHAIGSMYKGKKIGARKNLSVFSFYSNKNMTTAEGGIITTKRRGIEKKLRLLSLHGISKDAFQRLSGKGLPFYDVVLLGYKYNLPDLLSALGRAQLKKIDEINEKRRFIANYYRENLIEIDEISFQNIGKHKISSNHLFPIILDKKVNRDEFIKELKLKGVQASIHFFPVHLFSFYRKKFGFKKGELPITEKISKSEVSLPIFPSLDEDDLKFIVDKIKETIHGLKG